MKFEKLCEELLDESLNFKFNCDPVFKMNHLGKSVATQDFTINDKTYRISADMFDIKTFDNIMHIGFSRVEDDGVERTDLTKDNSGYVGSVYGGVLNWTVDISEYPVFKSHKHIIVIGENDDGNMAKGRMYGLILQRFLKMYPKYVQNTLLETQFQKGMQTNEFSIFAISKRGI